jgi:2-amino-4-hydroxy-6-hydroxymethyldihydropteridine diphosphokinase
MPGMGFPGRTDLILYDCGSLNAYRRPIQRHSSMVDYSVSSQPLTISKINSYIALGSNLGDRLEHLQMGTQLLEAHSGIRITNKSRIFETDPVGGPDNQGAYLNAVVRLESQFTARHLLDLLLEVEHLRGRVRSERWGPRTLDLDLLIHGLEVIHEPGLIVPHPRLHERAFVLEPLADLAPDLEIPGLGETVNALRAQVGSAGVWATELEF